MKSNFVILLFLAVAVYGCGSGRMIGTSQNGETRLIQAVPEKKPEWVESSKTFWHDESHKVYHIVGFKPDQPTVGGLGSEEAQADAVINLAQRIQTFANTRFGSIETTGSSGYRTLADLLVSMITRNIQLSLTMTERYWEEWQISNGGEIKYVYNIYTLNDISDNDLQRAVDAAVAGSKQKVEDPELRNRLDQFEKDVMQDLNNQR